MLVFLAVSRPTLPSFEGNVLLSKVNSDEGDANRISASAFELSDLINQITDHAIDLFDHCFRENFRFGADLDRRHWPSCD